MAWLDSRLNCLLGRPALIDRLFSSDQHSPWLWTNRIRCTCTEGEGRRGQSCNFPSSPDSDGRAWSPFLRSETAVWLPRQQCTTRATVVPYDSRTATAAALRGDVRRRRRGGPGAPRGQPNCGTPRRMTICRDEFGLVHRLALGQPQGVALACARTPTNEHLPARSPSG